MKKIFYTLLTIGIFYSCTNNNTNGSENVSENSSEQIMSDDNSGSVQPNKQKASNEFNVYTNERFGFVLRYPKTFSRYTESENGDGMSAYSDNGSMRLNAYASFNIFEDEDFYSIMETFKQWLIENGCTITYQFAKNNQIVLSGRTNGGLIYYEKNVLWSEDGSDYIATVYYEYPESEREAGDVAIALIGNFPKR